MNVGEVFRIKNLFRPILLRSFSILSRENNFSVISFLKPLNNSLSFNQEAVTYSEKMSKNLNLVPYNPLVIPACGLKVKGQLQLRCKDCYFERKDGRLYVSCSSYPRHKQVALTKRPKSQWILTYAFQSKKRPY